ncbi:ribonuclease Z [Acutalibacter muris]|uniref:ribonuclease Z n=1 Tax=Acutalibacter muris TaxID=1796620 RepID=UPI0026F3CE3D|nr:ribonuclease Z [Acutalibacter muris]
MITFIDSCGGMMFNHRRQSQDRTALQRIVDMTASSTLWMNEYSTKLFSGFFAPQVQVDAQFLDKAGPGDFCFVENLDVSAYLPFIEKFVLFYWNRAYPSDMKFSIRLDNGKWMCTQHEDFAGSSHEKITMEVYER